MKWARDQQRKDVARDQCCGDQPDDREQSELRQTRKAGEQQRSESAGGRRESEPYSRPQPLSPAAIAVVSTIGLHEEVNRVIDRFAGHRCAEGGRWGVAKT